MSEDVVIDEAGFRLNVGIVLANAFGELLWARRLNNADAWQFPQGGMQRNETPYEAMCRELTEELGLVESDIICLAEAKEWVSYRLPTKFQRPHRHPRCVGQKQKWFLLRLNAPDDRIQLDRSPHPEFDRWRWVKYWHPLEEIVYFKRDVYQKTLEAFAELI